MPTVAAPSVFGVNISRKKVFGALTVTLISSYHIPFNKIKRLIHSRDTPSYRFSSFNFFVSGLYNKDFVAVISFFA
jgi:hypothetical protein